MERWAIYIKLRISAYPVSALPLKENRGRTASFLEILGSSWDLIQKENASEGGKQGPESMT